MTITDILPAIAAYKATFGNGCGGSLHIVLDDGNVDDANVEFCRQWAQDRGDTAGEAIARSLLTMSKTQRRKIYHLFHGLPFPEDVHGREAAMEWLSAYLARPVQSHSTL